MLLRALILLLLVTGALAWWASAQWDSAPSYARETAAPSDAGRAAAERAEVPQRVGEHVDVFGAPHRREGEYETEREAARLPHEHPPRQPAYWENRVQSAAFDRGVSRSAARLPVQPAAAST